MKEMIRKMAASSVCTLMAAGMTAVSASAKTVASYDASTYNVNIVQKFSRKKHDFSLVDKNNDGKISSTEVNFGKIMYNFSAYKPYGKIKYPVVKKYYTTGTKTIKKKVKGKAVTTKKTIKGKTQYKYFVKSGSKTVFNNKKSNGYNVASANPKNNLTYVYAPKIRHRISKGSCLWRIYGNRIWLSTSKRDSDIKEGKHCACKEDCI